MKGTRREREKENCGESWAREKVAKQKKKVETQSKWGERERE